MNMYSKFQTFLFGETLYSQGGKYGPVTRPQCELILVKSGAVIVEADVSHHILVAGQAALVQSTEHLEYVYADQQDTRVTWCEASVTENGQQVASIDMGQPFSLPISRRMLDLQQMGMDLGNQDDQMTRELGAALGQTLFREFAYQAHIGTTRKPIHKSVLRARTFIEENLDKTCTLTVIADVAHVTPQYLIRLFRRDLGQTPVQYLWSARAKKAGLLLQRTGLSISEIAWQCGYENANHFSRHIKQHFGVPPTELRRQRWQ
jgi:AraC-like DNA-binding protein